MKHSDLRMQSQRAPRTLNRRGTTCVEYAERTTTPTLKGYTMLKHGSLALLMAAMIAVPLFAQPGPPADKPKGHRAGRGECVCREDGERMPMHGKMMEALNLTDQQKGQMEKLRTELEKKQVAVQGKIAVLRVDLKELFQAENPDRSAIEKKMKEVSDLQHQLKINGLDHLFAVKGILTPDQQKIWKKHLLEMGEERMGMGMERGGRMMKRGR
jgi:nickel and cobalt resistance protein CnrR